MGLGGISMWQLLIILLIVVLIFGTKRLKGMGGDLGGAIKSFKKAVTEEEDKDSKGTENQASKISAEDAQSASGENVSSKEDSKK